MRMLLAIAALCGALCVQLDGATTPLAVPFFELEELKISNAIAVGRYVSLIDQRSLYARRLTDGTVLLRIDDVGRAPFDIDGRRIVYAHHTSRRVVAVDLTANQREELWSIPDGARVLAVHAFDRSVVLTIEDPDGTRTIWSDGGNRWRVMAVPSHLQIAALLGHRLLAFDRTTQGRLMTATLDGAGNWVTLYQSAESHRIDSARPARGGDAVVLLERDASGAGAFVRVPIDSPESWERLAVPSDLPPFATAYGWSEEYVAWPERRDGRLFLSSVALARPAPPALTATVPGNLPRARLEATAARGVEWLERQLSKPFTSRRGQPARLIDSYEDAQRAGWIYDAALAAIAFTAAGDPGLATQLLAGMEHLQQDDGSWISSFHPDTALPRGTDRYVGAMAWVVMAINFFEWDTRDNRFASMARRGLDYLERHRVTDARSDVRGAFRMGPSRPSAISTEHNVDCYSAFLWRGRLERNQRDLDIAEDVRAFIIRGLWAEPGTQAISDGYFRVGAGADAFFLDAQTWTTLALIEGGEEARLAQALRSAEQLLRVENGRLGLVQNIIGVDEADASGRQKVWAEGTEGLVAAFFALRDEQRAIRYHAETARYQSASGGIPYATENRDGWTTAPSVAATGWYVLNGLNPPRNPFSPGTR